LNCCWHVQKNFISHFSGLGRKDKSLFDKIKSLPFITRVDKFNDILQEANDSKDITDKQLEYLNKKLKTKQKWAKCMIKTNFAAGVCTTSRIEGLHAVIKKYLTSSCSLQKVFLCFRTLEQIEIDKFAEEYQRHQNKPSSNYEIQFLKEFEKVCSDYALRRIKPKFFKSLNYERKEIINKKLTSWYSKEIMFSFFREVFNLNSKFQHVVKLKKKHLGARVKRAYMKVSLVGTRFVFA